MKIFNSIIRKLRIKHRLCVILDPSDNSVMLSKKLYKKMKLYKPETPTKVLCFKEKGSAKYSFCLYEPKEDEEIMLSEIQVSKGGHIGFAAICPTVHRIFYDYGFDAETIQVLHVMERRAADGRVFFEIMKS